MLSPLYAISPVDGRYHTKTSPLSSYFSEYALIFYRVKVELAYLQDLLAFLYPEKKLDFSITEDIISNFSIANAEHIKDLEKTTNHDVKAVEYFIKEKLKDSPLEAYTEFVHFGLTSQDINNTAIPWSLKDFIQGDFHNYITHLLQKLQNLSDSTLDIPMLARTHGQPASPTRLGKEITVFTERLQQQLQLLHTLPFGAKFGGATGNFNAHYVAYPDKDWQLFAKNFVHTTLGLYRSFPTTQIEHYDHLAALCHNVLRINTIMIDFCRDIWAYISMDYFKQKIIAGEIGSSAMPHKVNPIDFENAEGNLGVANALFSHLAEKLPISRLQRDLTDSTVLRNIGVPFAHTVIAIESIIKGIGKLQLHPETIDKDLENNWIVVAEGIQTVLRREGYPQPYEALKELTRSNNKVGKSEIYNFIHNLNVSDTLKEELKAISPQNYVGR